MKRNKDFLVHCLLWIGAVILFSILFANINSCAQERTDPYYKPETEVEPPKLGGAGFYDHRDSLDAVLPKPDSLITYKIDYNYYPEFDTCWIGNKKFVSEDSLNHIIELCKQENYMLYNRILDLRDSLAILKSDTYPVPMSKIGYFLDDLEQIKIRYDFYKSEYKRLIKIK